MFRKILVPTDFSEPSVKMIEKLPRFKNLGIEEAVILYCMQTLNHFVDDTYVEINFSEEMTQHAKEKLEKMKTDLESQDIKTTVLIESGNPANCILEAAKKENISLIIMPSHRYGESKHFQLGSVTHSLLHHVNVPILIEKVKWLEDKEGNIMPRYMGSELFEKILLPTDFSEHSFNALEELKKMTDVGLKEVVLAHIQDVRRLRPHLESKMEEFNKIDQERLDKIKADLEKLGFSVKTIIQEGIPSEKISEIADEENANMIFISSHGRSPFKELILGSVTERVVLKTGKPVMVVKG